MSVKKINSCRLCNSKRLIKIVDFGKIALGNNLQSSYKKSLEVKKYNLSLYNCKNCNHFQLSKSVSPKILYQTNYTYLTGISKTFKNHFKNYSIWLEKKTNSNKNKFKTILDIGSNDGTCLSFFKKKGFEVLGVDPAYSPSQIANKNNIKTINNFFTFKVSSQILDDYGQFDLITSHNVLAHIDNIRETFTSIYNCLKFNGYFCFEIGYFREVLKKNLFDTIYHEHLDYHHANPLCNFLNKVGFSVKSLSVNSIQGGSLRILCKKEKNVINSKQVVQFQLNEKKSFLYNQKYLKSWQINITNKMNLFGNIIKSYDKQKFLKVGYGSPTKIVLLMKLSNLNKNDIEFVFEDNTLKINRFLPTTGIKINKLSNKYMRKPLLVSVFAWNFLEEIVSKLKIILPSGSIIICPLPKLKIIKL